jgi:hypothetical protein
MNGAPVLLWWFWRRTGDSSFARCARNDSKKNKCEKQISRYAQEDKLEGIKGLLGGKKFPCGCCFCGDLLFVFA